MHTHFFFCFLFFLFFGLGPAQPTWAGLDPAGLAGSQAWPGWPFLSFCLPAGVREPLTHACYSNMQLKCREGQRNLPVAALEDGDDNWPALLFSVTAFCLLLCFSFPCSVVFFFLFRFVPRLVVFLARLRPSVLFFSSTGSVLFFFVFLLSSSSFSVAFSGL